MARVPLSEIETRPTTPVEPITGGTVDRGNRAQRRAELLGSMAFYDNCPNLEYDSYALD